MCISPDDPEDHVEESYGLIQRTTLEISCYLWEIEYQYGKPCSLAPSGLPNVPLSQWWKDGRFDHQCPGSLEHRSTMVEWLVQPVSIPISS